MKVLNNTIEKIPRYNGMCLTFKTYPTIVSDNSALFELEGYKYISFGFNYAEDEINKIKSKVSKGDINQLDIFTSKIPIFSPYYSFLKFTDKYSNISVYTHLFPDKCRYGNIYHIESTSITHISTMIVGYNKINDIEISLVTKHKSYWQLDEMSSNLILYVFRKICDEIINFMNDYYDPLYNSKKLTRITDYFKLIYDKNSFTPLNFLFREKKFEFKNYDIIRYINDVQAVVINIFIK